MSYFFQVNNYPVSNYDLSLPPLPCTKMPAYISVYSVNYFLTISIIYLSNLSKKNTPIALECECSTSFPLYIQFIYPLCMLLGVKNYIYIVQRYELQDILTIESTEDGQGMPGS